MCICTAASDECCFGCGSKSRKVAWSTYTVCCVTGVILLAVGAIKVPACQPQNLDVDGCRAAATDMIYAGLALLLVPQLLLLYLCSTCCCLFRGANKEEEPVACMVNGLPRSDVTVIVHNTSKGNQLYKYDAAGYLMSAPDCRKEMGRSSPAGGRSTPSKQQQQGSPGRQQQQDKRHGQQDA